MIITQMFFDSAIFSTFVKDCRKWGIACPVIPGLMCINNYAGFAKMSKFCKTRVPDSVRDKMEAIKDDPDAVKEYGIEFGTQMCRDLMADGAPVLHFYTLNLEKVVYGVLDSLGLTKNALAATNEADAAAQVAKGSAWARVGDKVTCSSGTGIVEDLNEATGAAKIVLDSPPPGQASAIVEVAKGEYSKVF
jgi:methylenetetrahydrofolate reductase (NADPH)